MPLQPANLRDEVPDRRVVLDDQNAPLPTRPGGGQLGVGGANPTRRVSRDERFGLLNRSTRFSPQWTTSASSQPSAPASLRIFTRLLPSTTWAQVRTRVAYSHSRVGIPTDGMWVAAAAPSPGAGWSGSSGSSGSSSRWSGTLQRY